MKLREIKQKFGFLINTPFHPLWLLAHHTNKNFTSIVLEISHDVLDIGCGHKAIQKYIDNNINYIGLDFYQTARHWYGSLPDIYADAQSLPLEAKSFNNVLLLDVLEHLPDPKQCIKEISRILKPSGKLIIQVPFMYPIHDAPLDFQRWTEHGIEVLFENTGLEISEIVAVGKPVETAGLILNISLCKTLINLINKKSIMAVFFIFLPILIPVINIICILLSYISPNDKIMPLNYRVVATKK